jgi:hypothetical protein
VGHPGRCRYAPWRDAVKALLVHAAILLASTTSPA